MLFFDNVYFSYEEGKSLINGLSFNIEKGKVVSLLGKNGSGKSTIARLANGLLTPKKGKIFVDDIEVGQQKSDNEIKRRVGLVFQNPDNQFIGITVLEDLAFGLENLNLPKEQAFKRINEVSNLLGISEFLNFPPSFLSGGEKQKIAIASSLVLEPSFLILDEVTSLLDPVERSSVIKIVKRIAKERNIGVLYITHNPDEATIFDKTLILNEGKVEVFGLPEEVLVKVEYLRKVGVSTPSIVDLSYKLYKKGLCKRIHINIDSLLRELC